MSELNLGGYDSVMHMLADALMDQFEGSDAVNYIEQTFGNKEEPSKSFVLTMQMTNGLTPCQKLAKSEADNKLLREALSDVIDGYHVFDLAGMTGLSHQECEKIIALAQTEEA